MTQPWIQLALGTLLLSAVGPEGCEPVNDLDSDGFEACGEPAVEPCDCDDSSGAIFPGAPEAADGLDNDCDGVIDEAATTFDVTLPVSRNSIAYDVVTTRDGGYVMTGSFELSEPVVPGLRGVLVQKISAEGELEWQQQIEEGAGGEAKDVAEGPGGLILVAGSVRLDAEGNRDRWAAALAYNGQVLWTLTVPSPDLATEEVSGVVAYEDGGFAMSWRDMTSAQMERESGVMRVTNEGVVEWDVRLSDRGYPARLWGLAMAPDGDVVAVGTSYAEAAPTQNNLALRLSPSGQVRWLNELAPGESNFGWTIAPAPDGGFIIGGTDPTCTSTCQGWLARKIDGNGSVEWTTLSANPSINDRGDAVIAAPGGGFIITGYWEDVSSDQPHRSHITALTEDGHELWTRLVPEDRTGGLTQGIALGSDPGYIIAGQHTGQVWAVKTNLDGQVESPE